MSDLRQFAKFAYGKDWFRSDLMPRNREGRVFRDAITESYWLTWQAAKAEAAERERRLVEFLRRYRKETPLGHQPHMIAHKVDELLASIEQEQSK